MQIPAGTFEFGPPTGTRKVTITKPFFLGQYEVLHGQFDLFVKAMVAADKAYKTQAETVAVLLLNKSGGWTAKKDKTTTWVNPGFAQTPTHPGTRVTWKEAQDFCKWAGEKSHVTLRLPTDAEWEYACRAGTKTLFSFPHPNDLPEYGNFADKTMTKAGALDDHVANTAPMGTYKPNPWNLFDMHGNVLEWCEDWYQSPPPAVEKDPHGPESGTLRVIRGGSWASPPVECSSSFRRGLLPGAPSPMVGFRVVAETVPETAIVPTPVSPLPTAPPPPDVLASDLTPLRGSSHYERDLSATRAPLKVAGQDYPRGIGLAAGGTLILPVKLPDKPAFKRFVGVAGLDDTERTTKPNTALRCRVFLGDAEVAATPVLRYGALTSWPVDVAIPADADVQELRLVVEGQTPGATPDGQIHGVNVGFRN
ncbi:MAG: SUMF1/EgtB/PvdO family nonheme iron enzyme [Planctomycetota bacterium]|nr:SUMF1/EgtB/PvdO family nonheme iron enzyme [Planctomycetota bacterium]